MATQHSKRRLSGPLDALVVVRVVHYDLLVVVGNHVLAMVVILFVVDVDSLVATGWSHPGDRVVGGCSTYAG